MDKNTRLVSTPEVDFNLQQGGENPDTVFIHGFGGDMLTWDRIWCRLDARITGLRYDLRGYGQSRDKTGEAFSHAEDLRVLLETLGLGPVNLVGSSMGGATAINFALNWPHLVRRLVLFSPALVAWDWSDEWRRLWRPMVDRARDGDLDGARALWWQHPIFESVRQSDGADDLYAAIMRFAGTQWVVDHQVSALPDVDRLMYLEPATLLFSGGRDMADFQLIADLLAGSVPNLMRRDFPDSGHMLPLERPQACAATLMDFLSGD